MDIKKRLKKLFLLKKWREEQSRRQENSLPDPQICIDAPMVIGETVISFENVENDIEEFYNLYQRMPDIDNTYGMKSPHLFLMWIALRQLSPTVVIESGIYKGLGTWWIENAISPSASLFCIDVNMNNIEYKSSRAMYLDEDFSKHTWDGIDRKTAVIFFDDHQNALTRLMQMKWMGFTKAIFEDNYPPLQGDCYSCKKILSQSGFYLESTDRDPIPDMFFFKENVKNYQEFPPVFQVAATRWGDTWDLPFYKTPNALLTTAKTPCQKLLLAQAATYTWMCFVELMS